MGEYRGIVFISCSSRVLLEVALALGLGEAVPVSRSSSALLESEKRVRRLVLVLLLVEDSSSDEVPVAEEEEVAVPKTDSTEALLGKATVHCPLQFPKAGRAASRQVTQGCMSASMRVWELA